MNRVTGLAMAGFLLTSCSAAALPQATPAASTVASLEARPLHLPSIDPKVQSCPVTSGRPGESLLPGNQALAAGPGPVYPFLLGPSPATAAQSFYAVGDGWQYAKVAWVSRSDYQGPVVIRGARIDGEGPLRFDGHPNAGASLELTSTTDDVFHPGAGSRGWPTGLMVQSRGCYALQVDGSSFSAVIVFLALVDTPPSPLAHAVSGGCSSTTVYEGSPPEWLVDAAGGAGAPTALPYFTSSSGLIGGFIFGYPLRAGQPDNPTNKVLWAVATARNGSPIHVAGHPSGATAPAVALSFPDDSSPGEIYPSIVDVPSPGCWTLTLNWGTAQAEVGLTFVATA